jgi:hypothetical protein
MSARPYHQAQADLAADASDVVAAAIAILQMFRVPEEFVTFLLAVIAMAGGKTDWFECQDRVLGTQALGDDTHTTEAKKKWVQRKREKWCAWQDSTKFRLVECAPGGKQGDEFYNTRYRPHILRYIRECAELGQNYIEAGRARDEAFKMAAWKIMPDAIRALAKAHSKVERFKRARHNPDAKAKSKISTAVTFARNAIELERMSGGDPVILIEPLLNLLRTVAPGAFVHTKTEEEHVDTGAADSPPVPTSGASPGMDIPEPSAEELARRVEDWNSTVAAFVARKVERGGGTHVVPPSEKDVDFKEVIDGPHDTLAVDIFESVGAVELEATLLHDPSPDREKNRGYEILGITEFRAKLPRYLEKNRNEQFHNGQLERAYSLAVRPSGERHFWQIDDADAHTARPLKDVAFLIIETSPGNYQIWLALSDEVDLSDKKQKEWWKEQWKRLIRKVGGNGGSWGALRWPGTFNNKPERERDGVRPVVRIVRANRGRVTTLAELEDLGLLAPEIEKPKKVVDIRPRNNTPTQWPSWERELSKSALITSGDRKGLPDRSDADFRWCLRALQWGWSEGEVMAELRRVSPKAAAATDHYIRVTVEKAANYVTAA